MFGEGKPSSHFFDVLILLAGMAVISQVQTCQVRRALSPEIIRNRDVSDEILSLQRQDDEFWRQSVSRHEKTQSMLRGVLSRLPQTQPTTRP